MKLADLTAEHAMADLQVKVLGYLRCSRAAGAVHAGTGLGTDRQRVGLGGAGQREHGGVDPQRVRGGADQESGGRAGTETESM